MYKKNYYILLFLCCIGGSYAQTNLIRNPSFENTVNGYCPNFNVAYSYEVGLYIEHWQADGFIPPLIDNTNNGGNTPDYYKTCGGPNNIFSVPNNAMGYQQAKAGNAYMGIIYSYDPSNSNDIRISSEYLIQKLEAPLTAGQKYDFSMFVSLADYTDFGVSHLGAAFVDVPPFVGGYLPGTPLSGISPQIEHSSAVTDTVNWKKIFGTFTAQGNEEYIIIGIFKSHLDVNVVNTNPNNNTLPAFRTYYLIDDVSLTKTSLSTEEIQNKSIRVFPNPANDFINIVGVNEVDIKSITIYDTKGKEIISKNRLNGNKVDISKLSAGIYMMNIITKNDEHINEKIIKK